MVVVGFLPRPMTSLALGSWLGFQYQTRFLSCVLGLKSSQRAVGDHRTGSLYTCRVVMPCWWLSWFMGIIVKEDNWLCPSFGRLHDAFWYHEKLIFIEGSFRSIPAQGPLSPISAVHGVFNNRFSTHLWVKYPNTVQLLTMINYHVNFQFLIYSWWFFLLI